MSPKRELSGEPTTMRVQFSGKLGGTKKLHANRLPGFDPDLDTNL